MVDMSPYIDAKLYDPNVGDAARVEAMLVWLEELGWNAETILARLDSATLDELADREGIRDVSEFTNDQAAAALGKSLDEFQRLRRTVGLSPRPEGQPEWTAKEIDGFAALDASAQMFTEDEVNYFARVLGSSLSRIADAAVSLFLVDLEGPLRERGGTELDVVRLTLEVNEALSQLGASLDPMLRLQIDEASRLRRAARDPDDDANLSRMAVGFVDLVGFTSFSEKHTIAEVGHLVRVFEERAFDIVADRGGRVVKLIGDEVMFVAADAEVACEISIALISTFRDDHVAPRGGLAYGSLLARGGDYHGPVVNLASRIADLAVSYELLATTDVAERCPDLAFEPAGRRQIKGFEEPVRLVSLSA